MKVLILHGIHGHAGKHWMQWLYDRLSENGFDVMMPDLPNSTDPSYLDWIPFIQKIFSKFNHDELSDLIVVGHSMGVPAALEVIQDLSFPIKALYSIAGFYKDYGSELNRNFMSSLSINIVKAKNNIQNSFVIFGDDDPYVPQDILKELAIGLGVEPIILKKAGHVNSDTGYVKFESLLDEILNLK